MNREVMMELEFSLTRKDYADFWKLVHARMSRIGHGNRMMFAINLIIWIFIGAGCAGLFRFYEYYEGLNFWYQNLALSLWGLGLVGLFLASLYERSYFLRYSLAPDGHMLARQKLCMTEEGVMLETDDMMQRFSWSAFRAKEFAKGLLCLYIDNNQSVLIPKRAFDTPAQEKAFTDFIESMLHTADRTK